MKKIILSFASLCVALGMSASPKYVFMFIGDGMGMGHVMAAETYNRLSLGNEDNILMMQFPVASMALTYSASSPVTDSAAAGTALATGRKTKNGMVGMTPDTTAVVSIATQLKEQGYGVGIVTSVAYDDATPASYYAHRPNRNMFVEINHDGARSGFDFIGGAYTHVAEKNIDACANVFDDYRANGYTVAHGLKGLKEIEGKEKVLLTGGNPHSPNDLGYTIDSLENVLTLRHLTAACLSHLLRVSPERFFMMVEAGNIDHAAHGNDGAAVVKEVLNFQQSIRVAYDFYLQHPEETLIIVTADHDTGGMTVGVENGRTPTFDDIDYRHASKEKFNDYCLSHKDFTWEEMKQAMSNELGLWSHIEMTEKEEAVVKEAFEAMKANADGSQKTLYKEFNNFSAVVFDILNHKNGIGFTTFSHTGNPVPVFAIGEGCEEFSNVNNNIDIPAKIRDLVGLD